MNIIRYPMDRPLLKNTSVTIGNFDGVHLGHQALIKSAVREAEANDWQSVVVTMDPLPTQYFRGRESVSLLTSFKHKTDLIRSLGVDVLCVLNFNLRLSSMSPEAFFQDVLRHGIQAKNIIVGQDFKFGMNRSGDVERLIQLGVQHEIQVQQLDAVQYQEQRISSTRIRAALQGGQFSDANAMLGRVFSLKGRVRKGQQLGRTLGFPTINLAIKRSGFPLHGVYAAGVLVGGKWHAGSASVGFNPTVSGVEKKVEVHLHDFDQSIYGQSVEVLFYKKLRNEVEFDGLVELTTAIEKDVSQSKEFFAQYTGELV